MDATERLISGMYHASAKMEWRELRAWGLAELCRHFGATAGVWWMRGADAPSGELTQYPQPFLDPAALMAVSSPVADSPTVQILEAAPGPGMLLVKRTGSSGPINTLFLKFAGQAALPTSDAFGRVGSHLLEAGALALALFINRDDWLFSMGRSNRGSAALIDAAGTVYSSSLRFSALFDESGLSLSSGRLSFELPEEKLGSDGGEFMHGQIHFRLARHGMLYLLHARRPLPLDSLSPREQEIARALSDGKTLKSIARQYGIAVSTVANHTTRIYRKLSIYRREELVELIRARPQPAIKP